VKGFSLVARVLKGVALMANGLLIPAALYMCLLLMVADVRHLLLHGLIWSVLLVTAAVTVLLALDLPENPLVGPVGLRCPCAPIWFRSD
jgi:hypothetical protein